jgi:hypothetical protein
MTSWVEPEGKQSPSKEPERVFPQGNGNGKEETKAQHGSPSERPTPQNCGNGKATQAQVRALFALTKRANYSDEDVASLLGPLNAFTFQELTRESASQLITYLQTEVAA